MLVSAVQHRDSVIRVCIHIYILLQWAHVDPLNPFYVLCEVPGALLSWIQSSAVLGEDSRVGHCGCRDPPHPDSEPATLAASCFLHTGADRGRCCFSHCGHPAASLLALGNMLIPQSSAFSPFWAARGLLCRESRGMEPWHSPSGFSPSSQALDLKGWQERRGWECGGIQFIFL